MGLTTAAQDSLSLPGSGCETSIPTSIVGRSSTQQTDAGGFWKMPAGAAVFEGAREARQ